ncbi:von Willebrand factor A domain-containing protein 3A-like [Saccoglossus kowalevskii]|uniref:von Willebrand factor A domain-containing protein 3A-like n=1 Tax=Saccoglossus kowalevskii TaxID=10224 RepID=A0ABM0MUB6_SACKO|nr:PREDICTED: von Willebrand factor A domain-containing protein 3A-like [Saccoglossus kowalevskii]
MDRRRRNMEAQMEQRAEQSHIVEELDEQEEEEDDAEEELNFQQEEEGGETERSKHDDIRSSQDMENTFLTQGPRPKWLAPRGGGVAPDSMTITSVNQTYQMVYGSFPRPPPSRAYSGEKPVQHLQFEASVVNEFEYRLHETIEMYHNRIKWLLKGSKKIFGMVKGTKVAVVVDSSDANCGFGRLNTFQQSVMSLIDEQLHSKEMLYFVSFGTEVESLWDTPRYVNYRILDEARNWVNNMCGLGGCNLLAALKKVLKMKEIDTIIIVLGNTPDQSSEVLCDYVEQLNIGDCKPLHTVAYDCSNHLTNLTLRKLAECSGGRYHVYASTCEEQIYTGTDITFLLREIKKAQEVINKIKEMRQGMMGDALVSILNEISLEVQKLPASRFLPRPPNHSGTLNIEIPPFQPKTSDEWLKMNGLRAKKLSLYQILAPNAFAPLEEFIPIIKKVVSSTVHEKAMAQFQWHDGSVKNVHVDPTQLYDYQKKLATIVKLFEKRVDWLSKSSRRIFGTIVEKRIIILVDLSCANTNYLVHIQHSLRMLLEQQMANKEYINIIGFGSEPTAWKTGMQEPSEKNLQSCWRWILGLECSGSRNFMGALRMALENEEDQKYNRIVEGMYLFTSGIPDQMTDVACSYIQEATAGHSVTLHTILFNVDDYDVNGAIPGRYANISKTADCLRTMAHITGGRFHWFRETGIIESDDIKAILSEMDKSVNYSKKCAMLVESVKKKSLDYLQLEAGSCGEMKMLPLRPSSAAKKKQFIPPEHTKLTLARLQITESQVKEKEKLDKDDNCNKTSVWRPVSANKKDLIPTPPINGRPSSAKSKPEKKKRPNSGYKIRPSHEAFYTECRNDVGVMYRQYPDILQKKKSVRKTINHPVIPDREDVKASKEWLKKYSLSKCRLDLNKLVSGPDCAHVKNHVGALGKNVSAKYCSIFPSVNIKGTVKHLQLQAHELIEYEEQVECVLRRYLKRLQWLLSGSRRVFGTVTEKRVVVLVDTSGSMVSHMEELVRELVSLIWDQFQRENIKFNIIRFSGNVEKWRHQIVDPLEENCHDAVRWVSTFVASGNTCTLEALYEAFNDRNIDGVYLLTDGKPDSSTSLVLKEIARLNTTRGVKIHTISFNCQDESANIFLRQLSAMSRGRFHRCNAERDGQLFAHKLLSEGFDDPEQPEIPIFEGDDLQALGREIALARNYLQQSRSFRAMYAEAPKPHEKDLTHSKLKKQTESNKKRYVRIGRPSSAVVVRT